MGCHIPWCRLTVYTYFVYGILQMQWGICFRLVLYAYCLIYMENIDILYSSQAEKNHILERAKKWISEKPFYSFIHSISMIKKRRRFEWLKKLTTMQFVWLLLINKVWMLHWGFIFIFAMGSVAVPRSMFSVLLLLLCLYHSYNESFLLQMYFNANDAKIE